MVPDGTGSFALEFDAKHDKNFGKTPSG